MTERSRFHQSAIYSWTIRVGSFSGTERSISLRSCRARGANSVSKYPEQTLVRSGGGDICIPQAHAVVTWMETVFYVVVVGHNMAPKEPMPTYHFPMETLPPQHHLRLIDLILHPTLLQYTQGLPNTRGAVVDLGLMIIHGGHGERRTSERFRCTCYVIQSTQ